LDALSLDCATGKSDFKRSVLASSLLPLGLGLINVLVYLLRISYHGTKKRIETFRHSSLLAPTNGSISLRLSQLNQIPSTTPTSPTTSAAAAAGTTTFSDGVGGDDDDGLMVYNPAALHNGSPSTGKDIENMLDGEHGEDEYGATHAPNTSNRHHQNVNGNNVNNNNKNIDAKDRVNKDNFEILKQHALVLLLLSYHFLPPCSMMQFEALNCVSLKHGGSFLRADTSISCDSKSYLNFKALLIIIILVYQSIPLVWLLLLWRLRSHLNPLSSGGRDNFGSSGDHAVKSQVDLIQANRKRNVKISWLSFLWEDYMPAQWYFEVLYM
jgi:hypothetical protein